MTGFAPGAPLRRTAAAPDPVAYVGVPGVVETKQAHGETTLVVEAARLLEACTHLRDELGFSFLSDISAADYLGWGEHPVAGYIGTPAGRDINAWGSQGYARKPDPKPKRFAMNYHLLALPHPSRSSGAPEADGGSSAASTESSDADGEPHGAEVRDRKGRAGGPRVRVQVWLDDGEPVPSVVGIWPTADWHEREAYDMMGIPVEGHPNLTRILMDEDWVGHPLRKDYPIGGEPVRFSGEE